MKSRRNQEHNLVNESQQCLCLDRHLVRRINNNPNNHELPNPPRRGNFTYALGGCPILGRREFQRILHCQHGTQFKNLLSSLEWRSPFFTISTDCSWPLYLPIFSASRIYARELVKEFSMDGRCHIGQSCFPSKPTRYQGRLWWDGTCNCSQKVLLNSCELSRWM